MNNGQNEEDSKINRKVGLRYQEAVYDKIHGPVPLKVDGTAHTGMFPTNHRSEKQ